MRRASFFLTVAAGLVASLALSASTQAGTITVSVSGSYSVAPADVEDVTFIFSSPITLTGTIPAGLTGDGTDELTYTPPTTVTGGTLSFTGTLDSSDYFEGGQTYAQSGTGRPGNVLYDFTPTYGAIPEPTSVALLGVGMAGFFAFRRMFRKRPATV